MASIFRRITSWHRRLEQNARRRHLIQLLSLNAEESRRLEEPVLAELLYLCGDLWVEGNGKRAAEVLERLIAAVNYEARFGPQETSDGHQA